MPEQTVTAATPDLGDLRRLLAEASARPWKRFGMAGVAGADWEVVDERRVECDSCGEAVVLVGCATNVDAALIATAVNALPHLLDRAEAADRLAAGVRAFTDALRRYGLAHSADELGALLDPAQPAPVDETRCDYFSTDIVTTRSRSRADGWRCGDQAGHAGNHTLYSLDGERVLYSATWGQRPAQPTSPTGDADKGRQG